MHTIRVMPQADGSVKVETEGFSGTECQTATKDLERRLGLVVSDTPTAEMRKVGAVTKVGAQ